MKILIYSISTARALHALEGSVATIDANIAGIQPGAAYLDTSADTGAPIENLSSYRVLDGAVVYDPPPSVFHRIDPATGNWIDPRTLADHQQAKWAEIKAARSAAEFGGFTWDGSVFDSDPTSQSRIQGASQLATLAIMNSQPFSIDWTLADNTVRTLSAADMLAAGMAMGEHINAQHAHARLLRAAIEAAVSVAEVAVIVWPA